jgi:hypothetical protein
VRFQHIGKSRRADERGPETVDVYLDRQFHGNDEQQRLAGTA